MGLGNATRPYGQPATRGEVVGWSDEPAPHGRARAELEIFADAVAERTTSRDRPARAWADRASSGGDPTHVSGRSFHVLDTTPPEGDPRTRGVDST